MKIIHIGMDLVPQAGGIYSTVKMMTGIVPARVLSFTRRKSLPQGSNDPNTLHLPVKDNFLGQNYGVMAEKEETQALEWLGSPDLLVNHGLYRDHVRFVRDFHEKTGTPYLAVPHGALDPWVFTYRAWQKRPWMALQGTPYLKAASAVIFATGNEARKAAPWTHGCRAQVIPWPVVPLTVENKASNRAIIREKLGIPQEANVALYLGRLHPMKNPLTTIEAFARTKASPWHLVLVGPEEAVSHEECRALAKKLGYRHLHLTGPIFGEEKVRYYHMADLFVLLSERENFGNSVAEAMSTELPVLVSDGVDIHDAVSEARAGWVLRKQTGLYDILPILEAYKNTMPPERAAMGHRGREWVLNKASPSLFREAFLKLCEEKITSKLTS